MRLWLDDTRKPPWGYDLWARTADQAIEMLQRHGDEIEHCSLDHDLHETHYAIQEAEPGKPWDRSRFKEKTGYAVIEWMIANNHWVPEIHVHSLSTGAQDMIDRLREVAPVGVKFQRVKPRQI